MMAGAHPSEIELFEYVEEDLEEAATVTVRAHLETCPACAATVTELEQARRALRDSPLLGLPAARLDAILATLPRQERDRPALLEFLSSPKRLVAVLAPVAAVVVAVVALTTTGGGGDDEEAAREAGKAAPAATMAQAEAEAGAATGGALDTVPLEAAVPPVVSVQGPAKEVVKLLEAVGYQAEVVNGTVEVSGATEAEVRKALEGRPAGDVAVFLKRG